MRGGWWVRACLFHGAVKRSIHGLAGGLDAATGAKDALCKGLVGDVGLCLTPAEAAEAEYVVHEEVPADQPEEHKACPQCGAPVSDDALFCNKCGAQL